MKENQKVTSLPENVMASEEQSRKFEIRDVMPVTAIMQISKRLIIIPDRLWNIFQSKLCRFKFWWNEIHQTKQPKVFCIHGEIEP